MVATHYPAQPAGWNCRASTEHRLRVGQASEIGASIDPIGPPVAGRQPLAVDFQGSVSREPMEAKKPMEARENKLMMEPPPGPDAPISEGSIHQGQSLRGSLWYWVA